MLRSEIWFPMGHFYSGIPDELPKNEWPVVLCSLDVVFHLFGSIID